MGERDFLSSGRNPDERGVRERLADAAATASRSENHLRAP
jgi:hypothetical protein